VIAGKQEGPPVRTRNFRRKRIGVLLCVCGVGIFVGAMIFLGNSNLFMGVPSQGIEPVDKERGQAGRIVEPVYEEANGEPPIAAGGRIPISGWSTEEVPEIALGAAELAVSVRWSGSGEPASGILIEVLARTGDFRRGYATDEEGTARFSDVPCGMVVVYSDRGTRDKLELKEGDNPHTIILAAGNIVAVRVEDMAGRRVARARILGGASSSETLNAILSLTNQEGEATISGLEWGSVVCATHDDWTPSPLRAIRVHDNQPAVITLRLGEYKGTVLTGQVVGETGAGISSFVAVESLRPSGVNYRLGLLTDDNGKFEATGLPCGELSVTAQAEGYPRWSDNVEMNEGSVRHLRIVLVAGVEMQGRVWSSDNRPVAGASVWVFSKENEDLRKGRTDNLGRYRLPGVAVGEIAAGAYHSAYGRQERDLTITAGAHKGHDFTLVAGLGIVGNLLDSNDAPLAGWTVGIVRVESENRSWVHAGKVDKDGQFEVWNCDDAYYDLEARSPSLWCRAPVLVAEQQRPGAPRTTYRIGIQDVPASLLVGRIVHQDGSPHAGARGQVRKVGERAFRTIDIERSTGEWSVGPIREGEYEVSFEAPKCAAIAFYCIVGRDQRVDAGDIRLPAAGMLKIELDGPFQSGAYRRLACNMELLNPDGVAPPLAKQVRWELSQVRRFRTDGRTITRSDVVPGNYRISITGQHVEDCATEVRVQVGTTAEIFVHLKPVFSRTLEFAELPSALKLEVTSLRLRDSGDKCIREKHFEGGARGLQSWYCERLRHGQYAVEVVFDNGISRTGEFAIAEKSALEAVEVVHLQ